MNLLINNRFMMYFFQFMLLVLHCDFEIFPNQMYIVGFCRSQVVIDYIDEKIAYCSTSITHLMVTNS